MIEKIKMAIMWVAIIGLLPIWIIFESIGIGVEIITSNQNMIIRVEDILIDYSNIFCKWAGAIG